MNLDALYKHTVWKLKTACSIALLFSMTCNFFIGLSKSPELFLLISSLVPRISKAVRNYSLQSGLQKNLAA